MTADNAGSDEIPSDVNPYHPPSPSEATPDHRFWLPTLWNAVLIGIALVPMLAAFGAVGWIVARAVKEDAVTGAMLQELASITRVTLFFLLFLLSLSTPFWRPRGTWWRAVYVAEAFALLVDFAWLRPTAQSLMVALLFVVLVLPVLLRGYGWVGVIIRGWRLLSLRQHQAS